MNTCPHCKAKSCLPLWRKLFLGPTGSAHCQVCGYRVGLDVRKALFSLLPASLLMCVLLPVVLFVYLFDLFPNLATGFFIMLVMLALLLLSMAAIPILFAFWVPLRVDELTTAHMV